jgi:hypothetical protein
MNALAERYVRLILGIGQHDPDYVDAYYGPETLKPTPSDREGACSFQALRREADALTEALDRVNVAASGEIELLRLQYLRKQVSAARARLEMLSGRRLSFDEESSALYDAVAPAFSSDHFERLLADLDERLPGSGPVSDRLDKFRQAFVIPRPRLDDVFQAAVRECRRRTQEHIQLPKGEDFKVEYVSDKPWSGYNWYKGGFYSLIQVNTDLPIFIDRAIDLACHEGYPGHHVYNTLLEAGLVRERGWIEFTVYALFSPQSLIAEGTANHGIEVTFPVDSRVAFEREVLFPAAGLDPRRAGEYYVIHALTGRLAYAGNEAARSYLDGRMTGKEAADWLVRYALFSPERAAQRIRFFEKYRSYVINYNLGQDLIKSYIERHAGASAERRWEVFTQLITTPRTPGGLRS